MVTDLMSLAESVLDLEVRQPPGVREKDMFEFERARWQVHRLRSSASLGSSRATTTRARPLHPPYP